jgi:exonuclease III
VKWKPITWSNCQFSVVPINIASVNVCGISRKYAPIKNFIDSDKIQILAMSEMRSPRPIKIKKFVTYQRDSNPNPKIRGVALLVSDALPSVSHNLPQNLTHLEAIAAKLTINNLTILIISYYNPPSEKVSAELLFYLTQFDHAIILGEFNARHTDFGDTMTNANGRILMGSQASMPLCRLHNTSPTLLSHKGCSITDHIIITERFGPFINTSSHIDTTVTSDHLPLVTNLTIAGPPRTPQFHTHRRIQPN